MECAPRLDYVQYAICFFLFVGSRFAEALTQKNAFREMWTPFLSILFTNHRDSDLFCWYEISTREMINYYLEFLLMCGWLRIMEQFLSADDKKYLNKEPIRNRWIITNYCHHMFDAMICETPNSNVMNDKSLSTFSVTHLHFVCISLSKCICLIGEYQTFKMPYANKWVNWSQLPVSVRKVEHVCVSRVVNLYQRYFD